MPPCNCYSLKKDMHRRISLNNSIRNIHRPAFTFVYEVAVFSIFLGFSGAKIPFPESFKPHAAFTIIIHDRQIQ